MSNWIDFLETELGISPEIVSNLISSLGVLLILFFLRRAILRLVKRTYSDQPETIYTWLKGTQYAFYGFAFVLLALLWIPSVGNVGTFLGIFSAGLAIAFQDPLINFAGWVFIVLRRPFTARDRIQIAGFAGDVVDIGFFQFTLLEIGNWVSADQSTGRVLHVPNGKVFTEPVANYSQGLSAIWHEIPVMITFESDWEMARSILMEIAEQNTEKDPAEKKQSLGDYILTYTQLTPNVYVSLADSGVLLTMRYLVQPRNRRGSHDQVTQEILQRFKQAGTIDFAYETRRNITTPGT